MRRINIARLIGALALSCSIFVPVHPAIGLVATHSQEPLVLAASFEQTQTNSSFVNDLSQGLVVYMPFDNSTFSDQSGYGNNGIPSGSVQFCGGVSGKGICFSGTSNPGNVTIPASASLPGNVEYTYSIWYKFNILFGMGTGDGTVIQTLFCRGGDSLGLCLMPGTYPQGLYPFRLHLTNGICCSGPNIKRLFGPAENVNVWHMVTVSGDSQNVRLYRDSQLIAEMNTSTFGLNPANQLQPLILSRFGSWYYPFNGDMDELRVYNRALSQQEITQLYQNPGLPVQQPQGTIVVNDSLRLSSTSPKVGNSVQASFKIKNTSDISITFNAITAGSRKGTGWSGEVFDWPVLPGKTLEPGEVFTYTATRLFNSSGDYFAEPVIQMNSSWGGIASANRVQFKVEDLGAGSIQVTYNAPLVPSQPITNQQVMARFQVANMGNSSVDIQWLRMGGRLGADWNGELADWPAKTNIHLNPGQSYIYQAERTFNKAGDYFAEPVMSLASGCCGIAGATRQYFTVTLPVSQTSSDTTPPSGDIDLSMSTPDLTQPIYGQKTVIFVPSILDDMSGIYTITPTIFYSGTWHDQNPFIEQRQGVHFTFPYKTHWSIPDGSPSQVITFAYIASDWAGNVSDYLGQRGVQYIAPDTDRFAPSGELQSASLENGIVTLTAAASDGITGSGISKVEFYALYDGIDHLIGESRFPPYTLQWDMPQIEHPQLISFTISVIDNVGNRQDIKANGKTTLSFWTTSTNIEQRWVTNRQYLNQRALNTTTYKNGDSSCGVTSASMILGTMGVIAKEDMAETARSNFPFTDINSNSVDSIKTVVNNELVQRGFNNIKGVSTSVNSKDFAWQTIKASIDRNLPLIYNSTPQTPLTQWGHYITIMGYRVFTDPVVSDSYAITRELIVYDPYGKWLGYDSGLGTSYGATKNSNQASELYNGSGKWAFYNFDKLFKSWDYLIYLERAPNALVSSTALFGNMKGLSSEINGNTPDVIAVPSNYHGYYEGAGQISGSELQTITFGSIPNQLLSQQIVVVSANSTSGLTVTFNSLTPFVCDVTGSTVLFLKYGICAIQASQFGDATFATAEAATQSFPILHGYFLPNTIRQTPSGW